MKKKIMQFKDHRQKDHVWQPNLNLGKKEKVISYDNSTSYCI